MTLSRSFWNFISLSTPVSRVFLFSAGLLILAVLPTKNLDYLPIRSIWETFLGIKPYSSGITRSMSLILHGDFTAGWLMNPLAFGVLGIIGVLLSLDLRLLLKRES